MRSTEKRVNPLLPWAAGAVLSVLVLALTVVDEGWLGRLAGWSSATSDAPLVVAPFESPALAVPDLATVAPETETGTAPVATPAMEPAPVGKSAPRIVPISPDGRGTASARTRPDPGGAASDTPAPERSVVPPQPDAPTPRIIPISLERPEVSSNLGDPRVQLVGAAAADEAAGIDLIELDREAAGSAPAAPDGAGIRLFIHYGAAQPAEAATATRLADYLHRRGFEVAGLRPVEFAVERPGVRFFFTRDKAESQRLLEDLGWFFRGTPRQAPEQASDFTHYTPRPRPGTVEIWLPTTS